jgi:hypothetical protein
MSLVNLLGPCRFVGKEFASERSLGERPARDRHGAPVGLKEEMHALELGDLIPVFQGEDPVGDDAELGTVMRLYTPLERLTFRSRRKLVFVDQSDAFLFSAGEFKGHHHVGNQKGVLKEYAAHGLILPVP